MDTEVVDIEIFDGMKPHDVKKKVDSMMQSLTSHFVTSIEDERKISQKAKENERILSLKNKELQAEVSRVNKELADCEARFEKEAKGITNGAKRSVAMAILKARLQMVEDVEAGKQDDWDVESWQQSLEMLMGEMGEDVHG